MAGAYAWFLADTGTKGAKWLAEELVAQMQVELLRICRQKLTEFAEADGIDIAAICRFETRQETRLEQKLRALDSVKRLAHIGPELENLKDDLREAFDREMKKFAIACPYDRHDRNLEGLRSKSEREAAKLVPVRLYTGPVQLRGALKKVSRDEREWFYQFMKKDPQRMGLRFDLALFWSDGKRNLLEIADLVEAEVSGRDVEALVTYFRFLKRLKLIGLAES
jgi:hypothetical protein